MTVITPPSKNTQIFLRNYFYHCCCKKKCSHTVWLIGSITLHRKSIWLEYKHFVHADIDKTFIHAVFKSFLPKMQPIHVNTKSNLLKTLFFAINTTSSTVVGWETGSCSYHFFLSFEKIEEKNEKKVYFLCFIFHNF